MQPPERNTYASLGLLVAAVRSASTPSCSHSRVALVLRSCSNKILYFATCYQILQLCCCAAGPPSSVQLSTPYLDERVRLGKGSRGSLFVFTRGGAADQAGRQKRLATGSLITQVSSQGQTCHMATQLPNTDIKFSMVVLQLTVVHLVPPPTCYRIILVSTSCASWWGLAVQERGGGG
mgnify:FL=1